MRHRKPDADWRPQRIVQEPGAFVMPIGPKYSGVTESVHFLLETVGEDVIRSTPRLFYKWRAIEKLAEGKTVDEVLLLAERFAATTAFAHGLAFCQAVETICGASMPARARSSARVSGGTRTPAPARRRNSGNLRIHRAGRRQQPGRNFGGGFAADFRRTHRPSLSVWPARAGRVAVRPAERGLPKGTRTIAADASKQLNALEQGLRVSSSFLDRLEEVGFVALRNANVYGLLGPVARASGLVRDLRRAQPYSGYETFRVRRAERAGRRRLCAIARTVCRSPAIGAHHGAGRWRLDGGQRRANRATPRRAPRWAGSKLRAAGRFIGCGWTKTERIARYRVVTPSFANWHGFHLAVEKFAFQDFPIMLSTFDLSVAENDR